MEQEMLNELKIKAVEISKIMGINCVEILDAILNIYNKYYPTNYFSIQEEIYKEIK